MSYRLCSDKDEIINHIISESHKLVQKDYTRLGGESDPLGIDPEI